MTRNHESAGEGRARQSRAQDRCPFPIQRDDWLGRTDRPVHALQHSYGTSCVNWIKRFILFRNKRHPADLGAAHVPAAACAPFARDDDLHVLNRLAALSSVRSTAFDIQSQRRHALLPQILERIRHGRRHARTSKYRNAALDPWIDGDEILDNCAMIRRARICSAEVLRAEVTVTRMPRWHAW